MALIDRIKYDGPKDGQPWIVYKFPSDEFVLGSQLIVNQSQEALFLKGGEALDLFGAGTHTLITGNLPLLNKLVNLPFGGQTPFSAEVYYINKIARLDMRWGTSVPFPVEDPKYGILLSIRAFGQYGITIKDSRQFILQIIGAVPGGAVANYDVVTKYFNGIINTKIKDIVSKLMIRKKISFLEVTTYIDELSFDCKEAINDEFERFGIEIMNFYLESINAPKEEYEKLRQYKEELALGADFYRQRRSFDVLDKLADNPSAGGMATAGLGLGMGIGAGAAAGSAFADIASNIKTTSAPQQNAEIVMCPKCNTKNQNSMKFCGGCGEKLQTGIVCPQCGNNVPSGMKFCGECGQAIGNKQCPECGTENSSSMKFCGICGKKLGGDA